MPWGALASEGQKRRSVVLRAYDRLDRDREFNRRNIASVTYIDVKGEVRRAIQMTKVEFIREWTALDLGGRGSQKHPDPDLSSRTPRPPKGGSRRQPPRAAAFFFCR